MGDRPGPGGREDIVPADSLGWRPLPTLVPGRDGAGRGAYTLSHLDLAQTSLCRLRHRAQILGREVEVGGWTDGWTDR